MIDALGVGRISKVAGAGGQVRLVVLDQRGFEKKKKTLAELNAVLMLGIKRRGRGKRGRNEIWTEQVTICRRITHLYAITYEDLVFVA